MAPQWIERAFGVKRERFAIEVKKAKVGFISEEEERSWSEGYGYLTNWGLGEQWMDASWGNLVNRIYSINSAVAQCILKLALGYPEPPVTVKIGDEVRPDHPLQLLLDRPNPMMSHSELKQIDIIYRAVGGNTYLHKVRNTTGQVIELWPYHAGQMWPVPSRFQWIEEYEYDAGHGKTRRVPARDIIHLKWPMVDLSAPWLALSPLAIILREVMTDTEATRLTHSLLKNNAMPAGVVTLPPGTAMSPDKAEKLREKWQKQHGGDNRGGIVILEQGASYERVSMSPDEMSLAAVRNIPETRIAGNLGVPPIVAGLSVGLQHGTYSNYASARQQMTEETFVPMWRSDGNEITQAMQDEYSDRPVVAYNTSKVAALQENTNEKYKRAGDAFTRNIAMLDEARAAIDLPPIDQVNAGDTRGTAFYYELKPPQQMQRRIIDALVEPAQLTDGKAATGDTVMLDTKATEPLEEG